MASSPSDPPPVTTFPEASPHGAIQKVFENVYICKGEISIPMGVRMSFSRNMVILRQDVDDSLILVHTIRLSEEGLKELDTLGTVKHIIRLAAFHGRDDAFFRDRYKAKIWAVQDSTYVPDFNVKAESYLLPDEWMVTGTTLPMKKAELTVIESEKPNDGVITLDHPEGKILLVGDCFQNHDSEYMNWVGYVSMWMMGFLKPYIVGPAWAKAVHVKKSTLAELLEVKFDHVLPAHGTPVIGKAWKKFEPAVNAMKDG